MSVTHLGRIYEGLLEFRFERASETAVYLEYESSATKGKTVEAYFRRLRPGQSPQGKRLPRLARSQRQERRGLPQERQQFAQDHGQLLHAAVLSQPLVKAAVDHAIANGKTFTDLKILDNACGSGHFLVEALGYLTDLALAQLDRMPPCSNW